MSAVYSIEKVEARERSRSIYILSCAVVFIVLCACVATVVTAIYFSDNSPWRDVPACNGNTDSSLATNGQSTDQLVSPSEGDVVSAVTRLGIIKGKLQESSVGNLVEVYKGIPFAQPPVGGNRFKDPQPITKAYDAGVLEAFEFGHDCVQLDVETPQGWWSPGIVSEDCLYLNVWVPYPRREGRAVMVWIHGGSFTSGSGSMTGYTGDVLAGYGDVVMVNINYRLSVLGFIPVDIPGQSPGNQGIKDQQMALEWVRENIAMFGGDPNQVTIFGESAGAASVGTHLLLPSSKNLFTRAILQSGTPLSSWGRITPDEMSHYLTELSNAFECQDQSSLAECLRQVPAMDLYLGANTILPTSLSKPLFWVPYVDGEFYPEDPHVMVESGNFHKKDILIGVNKDEGTMFTDLSILGDHNTTWWYYAQSVGHDIGALQPDLIPQAYRAGNESSEAELFSSSAEITGDGGFVCPTNKFSREFAQYGSRVYYYYLTYRSPSSHRPESWGVAHADDLQWVFGLPMVVDDGMYSEAEKLLSKSFMEMWTNFAKYGNPAVDDTLDWESFSVRSPSYLELRGPYDFIPHNNQTVKEEICRLWF